MCRHFYRARNRHSCLDRRSPRPQTRETCEVYSMNGTLTTLHEMFFKEKTISRRIWTMMLLLGGVTALQIVLTVTLPRLILNRERAVIDSLHPIILTSTDVRRDVLSMIGGARQRGLHGKGPTLRQ